MSTLNLPPTIRMSLITTAIDYLLYFQDIISGRRFTSERNAAAERCEELSPFIDMVPPKDILDVGCGRLRPQSIIFSRWGHRVVGVDKVDTTRLSLGNAAYLALRGLLHLSTPRKSEASGSLTVVNADVACLPFADETFDVITSIAAFEHFLEVPKVVSEMKRVLRPGGVFTIDIHSFTSLSGGHTIGMRLDPIERLPDGIEPWDHLRKKRLRPSVPLNEWRIGQYLDALSAEFAIVKSYPRGWEGRKFLTPAIREQLSEYSEEELTCACYRILGMKERY